MEAFDVERDTETALSAAHDVAFEPEQARTHERPDVGGLLRLQQAAGNAATTQHLARSGLRVSNSTDRSERAADRRAGTELAGDAPGGFDPGPGFAAGLARSASRPISRQLRAELADRIGNDLSSMTIHTDDRAAELAESVQAMAFTHRNHIYLGAGVQDVASAESKNVLAHEAAHVAAHSSGQSDGATVHRVSMPEWMRKLFGRKQKRRAPVPVPEPEAAAMAPEVEPEAWSNTDPDTDRRQKNLLGQSRRNVMARRAKQQSLERLATAVPNAPRGELRADNAESLPTKQLNAHYVGEENKVGWRTDDQEFAQNPNAFTFYAKTPEQRRHYKAHANPVAATQENVQEPAASMTNANGEALNDSRGFVVSGQGELSTFKEGTANLGAIGENNPAAAHHSAEKINEEEVLPRFVMNVMKEGNVAAAQHHSTPLGGEGVAGAGIANFDKGFLKKLRDESGHYRPEAEYTFNSAEALRKQGAIGQRINTPGGLESTKIELMGALGTSGRPGKGWVKDDQSLYQGDITLPYQAFLQTQGNEYQMRSKAKMQESLVAATKQRAKALNDPAEFRRRRFAAEQANAVAPEPDAQQAGQDSNQYEHTYQKDPRPEHTYEHTYQKDPTPGPNEAPAQEPAAQPAQAEQLATTPAVASDAGDEARLRRIRNAQRRQGIDPSMLGDTRQARWGRRKFLDE